MIRLIVFALILSINSFGVKAQDFFSLNYFNNPYLRNPAAFGTGAIEFSTNNLLFIPITKGTPFHVFNGMYSARISVPKLKGYFGAQFYHGDANWNGCERSMRITYSFQHSFSENHKIGLGTSLANSAISWGSAFIPLEYPDGIIEQSNFLDWGVGIAYQYKKFEVYNAYNYLNRPKVRQFSRVKTYKPSVTVSTGYRFGIGEKLELKPISMLYANHESVGTLLAGLQTTYNSRYKLGVLYDIGLYLGAKMGQNFEINLASGDFSFLQRNVNVGSKKRNQAIELQVNYLLD